MTKRHLVVTFNDAWGGYGGAIPSIGWSYDQNAQPEDGGLAAFDTKDTVSRRIPCSQLTPA